MLILLLLVAVIFFALGVFLGPTVHKFIKMAQGDLKRGEPTPLIGPDEFWDSKPKTRKSKRKK